MSGFTQQDSPRNKSYFQVQWPGESPTQEEFLMTLPILRSLKDWEITIINSEESIAWDTLETDMRVVSTQHLNTIFTVKINDEDDQRWVQYHQAGRHYEALEVRQIPDFDPSKLRETQPPGPLDLNTPIIQVPTLQNVLQEALLTIEQHVWDMEVDQRFDDGFPDMENPHESHGKPFTHPEAALERVPRLREILGAAHQECNRSGEIIGHVMDVFHEHVVQVLNHWTFAERRELEALALEALTAKNARSTTEE